YLTLAQINGNALFGSIRTVGAVITGFDLDDPVIGDEIAGLAVVTSSCSSLGVSVNEGWGIATAVILAHEIGHNFGSCHDGDPASAFCPTSSVACANPLVDCVIQPGPYIMSPCVSPAATQFSACSIANICSHINVQTCYKQPIDIEILLQSVVPPEANALTQGNTSVRTFNVGNLTDVILTNVNILGALENLSDPNNANAEYTVVTLDGNACTIAANRQSYTCTIASIDANNAQTFIIIETVTATGTGQFMSTTQYKNIATEQRVDVEPQNSIVQLTHTVTTAVTPPAAPSNVQATSLSNGNIQVSWTDSSNNEQAFIIERSEDGGTVFNVIQANQAANTTSYIDTNVVEGQTYTYRVSASNSIGATAAANTPSATSSIGISAAGGGGGRGGGGGAFYLMTLFLLLARTFTKFR
ncbi:MAG: M12 family metallo-peptidase, partial [Gammaproteobacteria bacterium]|nr:M12 family metallo-peptidase [Gammaproteobacteria bacterium]